MIDSLTYRPRDDGPLHWAAKLDYFQRRPVTQFKPGLNILYGMNGSGKSTVLQMLALTLAAAQGGTSTVTSSWLNDVMGFGNSESQLPCDVVHDGQPVMFFDARAKEGLIGGSFDDDFFSLGVANTMAKGSTGQLGLHRIDRMLQVLMGKEPPAPPPEPKAKASGRTRGKSLKDLERKGGTRSLVQQGFPSEIVWKVHRNGATGDWAKRIAAADALLAAKRDPGPRTLLFDEPESGFSLAWQEGLWRNVFGKVAPERFQVIVATHSPFALRVPGAHYVEMSPDYLAESETAVRRMLARISAPEVEA